MSVQLFKTFIKCKVVKKRILLSARYKTNLRADLSWNTGKLWVGGKSSEVVHSFDERTSGSSALLSVLLVKRSIQCLQRKHLNH